jgi:hypothetical protein
VWTTKSPADRRGFNSLQAVRLAIPIALTIALALPATLLALLSALLTLLAGLLPPALLLTGLRIGALLLLVAVRFLVLVRVLLAHDRSLDDPPLRSR